MSNLPEWFLRERSRERAAREARKRHRNTRNRALDEMAVHFFSPPSSVEARAVLHNQHARPLLDAAVRKYDREVALAVSTTEAEWLQYQDVFDEIGSYNDERERLRCRGSLDIASHLSHLNVREG